MIQFLIHRQVKITDVVDPTTQVVDPRLVSKHVPVEKTVATFLTGAAIFCLDKTVIYHDLHEAMVRIQKIRKRVSHC